MIITFFRLAGTTGIPYPVNKELKRVTKGSVISLNPVQPAKAASPILVTLLGTIIEVNPIQPLKADSPILVTLSGIAIEVSVRLLHSEKIKSGIVLTLLPIFIVVNLLQP